MLALTYVIWNKTKNDVCWILSLDQNLLFREKWKKVQKILMLFAL